MIEMYIWSAVVVLNKVIFYVGFACIAGYTFLGFISNQVNIDKRLEVEQIDFYWVKVSIPIAMTANIFWFFANVGAMAGGGIQDALNPELIDIMWDSTLGDVAYIRFIGLILAILVVVFSNKLKTKAFNCYLLRLTLFSSLLILAYTYTLTGHASELGTLEKALLIFHVLVMAWWFGSLLPLKQACHVMRGDKLYLLMINFGKQAITAVSLLLVAGLWLAVQLVGSVDALLSSSYGWTLLFKLFLVICILGVAANHKLKLVPQLNSIDGRKALSKSISIEIKIAFSILTVTAILTSVVGP